MVHKQKHSRSPAFTSGPGVVAGRCIIIYLEDVSDQQAVFLHVTVADSIKLLQCFIADLGENWVSYYDHL